MGTGDKTQVVKLLLAKYLYPVSLIANLEVNFCVVLISLFDVTESALVTLKLL